MAVKAAAKRAAASQASNTSGGERESFAYVTYGSTLTPVGIYRGVSVALKHAFQQGLQVAPVESGELLEDAINRQEAKRSGGTPPASPAGSSPAAATEQGSAAASVKPA